MKRKQLSLLLPAFLLILASSHAQTTLVCNDLVMASLGPDCARAISSEEVLEGSYPNPWEDYIVELDKVAPYGNGPWVPANISINDVGKTYQIRVTDPTTGNKCWGNVSIVEELVCSGVTLVQLPSGQEAVLVPEGLQVSLGSNCLPLTGSNTTLDGGLQQLTYDCSDLGVHFLPVQVVTPNNITVSCTTTVVVDDPLSECDTCTLCPEAVLLGTFEAGINLLDAYNAGNWSAFDVFGSGLYNTDCDVTDSTYTVQYYQAAFGQNWFVRSWTGKNALGQTVGTCEQIITFPSSREFTVSGKVFIDSIPDCAWNPGENPYTNFQIRVTKLPSNQTVIKFPNYLGEYNFDVEMTGVDTGVQVQLQLPQGFTSSCPTTYLIPAADTTTQYTFDMGLRINQECPALYVDINTPFLRRCFNNYFNVRYCNFSTIPANNASAVVAFDSLFTYVSSSIPWSNVTDNAYTFPLGTVSPLTCSSFGITMNLSCDAELDQTICTEATLLPLNPCGGGSWAGAVVETDAYCDGDSVHLVVKNTGAADMTGPEVYFVIEDIIMYRTDNFQLNAGDSVVLTMPANGATWRIEAEQVAGYPELSLPSSAVEGCNDQVNIPGLLNAFPPEENGLQHDIVCEVVRGSYDPNDKAAIPTGYGDDHIIRANIDLEYKIRFQNTGTDTAFRVVIVDTLSALLDHSSLKAGASSHPYRLDVYPGGILHFVFDPIELPDSNVNEPGSHGFVVFNIAQQPNLADGNVIENKASIYFDFNEAVVTNTVFHTIGAPFVTVEVDQPLAEHVSVEVMPNPFRERTVLRLSDTSVSDGLLQVTDARGRLVHEQHFRGTQCELQQPGLAPGVYFFRISDQGRSVAGGKMLVRG